METLQLEQETVFDVGTNMEKELNEAWDSQDFSVIILLNKNFNFVVSRTPYDIDMCGKKMWEWIKIAVGDCEVKTITCTDESNILTLIKPYLTNKKYTVVLYSDTPLFCGATFNDILSYVRKRQTNVLSLERGYVFDTEYIKNVDSIMATSKVMFGGKNDFFVIDDPQKLNYATNVLKERILNFHINNGVVIENRSTTSIDADVIIGNGTVIKQNNAICGMTYIGKNCILEPNNIIKNSVISDNCVIKCSYIEESRISENIIVGPFENVISKSN